MLFEADKSAQLFSSKKVGTRITDCHIQNQPQFCLLKREIITPLRVPAANHAVIS